MRFDTYITWDRVEVTPIAFDSLGTRSMSTLIMAKSIKILIDPSAALGPRRYGLPPHPLEYEKLREHKEKISEAARESDIIIITHYHYDHIPRPSEDISWLAGKKLLIKDPHHNINYSQRMRARIFLENLKKVNADVEVVDGRELVFGKCRVKFSEPVQHGNDSRLGYVLQVSVYEAGETIIHTSDVEGIVVEEQARFIISNMPEVVICDGPMTYMLGDKYSDEDLKKSLKNLKRIIKKTSIETLILDHHLTRDREWRTKLKNFLEELRDLVEIHTAASYIGIPEQPLESIRDILWKTHKIEEKE
jgi:predicted metallo-beta-lactamase superfamily hydrolase